MAYVLEDENEVMLMEAPSEPTGEAAGSKQEVPAVSPVTSPTKQELVAQEPASAPSARGSDEQKLESESPAKDSDMLTCRVCVQRLCRKCFPKKNQCVCLECRRADEAAAKQVKGTEKEAQFKSIKEKGGPEYQKLILEFRKQCPAAGRGKVRATFDFTTYFKTVEHYNDVNNKAHCRYMTEVHYLAWAQTAEGGSYNAVEAKDKWDAMFADPLHNRDKNGKDRSDRLLIHMYDDVVGSSGTKSTRGYTVSGKTMKNARPDQLEAMDSLIASGHDGFNSSVFEAAGGAGLQLSLKTGNGSKLQKGGVHSQQALAVQDKPAANNAEETDDADSKKKKRKVDMQALRVTQHDKLVREEDTLIVESRECASKLYDALKTVTAEDEEQYKLYVDMIKTRKDAVEVWAMLDVDSANCTEAEAESAVATFRAYQEQAKANGLLPCPEFEHLVCRLQLFLDAKTLTDEADSQEAMRQVLKTFGENKTLVKNLFSCANRAVKDLASARKARQKTCDARVRKEVAQAAAKAKAKAKAESATSAKPKGAQPEPVAEAVPAIFKFVRYATCDEAVSKLKATAAAYMTSGAFARDGLNTLKPYIVEGCADLDDFVKKDEMASSRFNFFLRTFQTSSQRTGSGRGTMSLPEMQNLMDALHNYAPGQTIDPKQQAISDKEMCALLTTVGAYAFSENMRYCGTEFKQASTLRYQVDGTRRFAAAAFTALQAKLAEMLADGGDNDSGGATAAEGVGVVGKMKELGINNAEQVTLDALAKILPSATEDESDQLLSICCVAESRPKSITFMPAGFVLLDATVGVEKVTGFRVALMVAAEHELQIKDMAAIAKVFTVQGRDATLMNRMVQMLECKQSLCTLATGGMTKQEDRDGDEDDRVNRATVVQGVPSPSPTAKVPPAPAMEHAKDAENAEALNAALKQIDEMDEQEAELKRKREASDKWARASEARRAKQQKPDDGGVEEAAAAALTPATPASTTEVPNLPDESLAQATRPEATPPPQTSPLSTTLTTASAGEESAGEVDAPAKRLRLSATDAPSGAMTDNGKKLIEAMAQQKQKAKASATPPTTTTTTAAKAKAQAKVLVTHYSGYDAPGIAFSFVEHYLKKAGWLRSGARCVLPLHACDYAPLAQQALLSLPEPLKYEHIFCDMLDRVPDAMDAACSAASEQAAAKMHPTSKKVSSKAQRESASALGRELIQELMDCMRDVKFEEASSFCLRHKADCPIPGLKKYADKGMLTVAIAGLDWSCMGSKSGLLGSGIQANVLWVQERRQMQENLLFIECTSHFDEEASATAHLSDLYTFQSIILGPDDFGLPCTRQRKFCVGVLRQWGYMDKPLSRIGQLFRIRRLCGDVYLQAPDAEVQQHHAERAVERGFQASAVDHLSPSQLLPPAMLVRHDAYQAQKQKLGYHVGLCMLGQNAESFGQVTETVPALLRSSTVWCFGPLTEREMMAKEHLLVMGIPAYAHVADEVGFENPLQQVLTGPNALSSAQVKRLAGNSICIPVFGHLLVFVLSCLRRGDSSVQDDGDV
ncbi:unnamed protein product [Symbiodinium sp. CCMP2592]|nr:unnamed protein product [Symbiodinium sp. CCMP2592]